MRTIAVLSGRYLPGYKDGGPVRTLVNVVECLGKEYKFRIITNDRDHGDKIAYSNILYDKANIVGNAEVWYLPPGGFTFKKIRELTKECDMVYCLGPYDNYAYKAMILKRFGIMKQPLFIASMGSFSQGAFKIKNVKKSTFINVCKGIGMFKNIYWSVTSDIEAKDVKRCIGEDAKCYIAEDLPRKPYSGGELKEKDEILRIIFLSRICKKKNLDYAIDIVSKLKMKVEFDIYGNIEDEEYWMMCRKKIKKCSSNIKCAYKGIAESEKVQEVFSKYDIFLFPTLGENYGHVIYEALTAGCIPIISDQTPWIDLDESCCGRVIPLDNLNQYVCAIKELYDMDAETITKMKKNAINYAVKKYTHSLEKSGYRTVFEI